MVLSTLPGARTGSSADRFHIGQRGPDRVLDAGILGGAYHSGCLLDLVGTCFPNISDAATLPARPFWWMAAFPLAPFMSWENRAYPSLTGDDGKTVWRPLPLRVARLRNWLHVAK
jgi:hypothetical protein